MKFTAVALVAGVMANRQTAQDSPVTRVVELIKGLKAEILTDGKAEQASYDKYACWCEDTTARKVKDIGDARTKIEDLSSKIIELKGKTATLAADIAQAKKDIAANIESQKEATSVRNKEHEEYAAARTEAEQAHGALDGAIKVLAGAGEAKSKEAGLISMRTANIMSVVAGVRRALRVLPHDSLSDDDMSTLRSFLENPTGKKAGAFLQAKTENNPFGDYAPASTQIQGILKDMYDTFAGDLQEMNINEGTANKNFKELIATKKAELAALEATLVNKEASHGKATLDLAESNTLRDETTAQLKLDEAFLAETKKNCATKADDWAMRTRLRTEELGGIEKAIAILESGKEIFEESATTFTQLSSIAKMSKGVRVSKALGKVRSLATRTKSLRLASLGVKIRMAAEATGGHFDKVLAAIDDMIAELRKEGQDDIDHRDRCQRAQSGNGNELEDLKARIENLADEIKSLTSTIDTLTQEIQTTQDTIDATKNDMKEALTLRNEEFDAHKQAMKVDRESVALITKAIAALAKFYTSNKIALNQQEPEYSYDQDKAPETSFQDGNYGGRKSENTGIVAILEMIKEDIQNEMKTAAKEDAESAAEFTKMTNEMQASVDELSKKKATLETDRAETESEKAEREAEKTTTQGKEAAAGDEKKALATDCAWVETHFDSRAEKRASEISGLQEAKSFLSGMEA